MPHNDEIKLTGLVFFGTHGVNPEERALGQRFGVSLWVRLDLETAAQSDRVEDTVSYSALYRLVRSEVEGEPSNLLEHLAARVLTKVLSHDARIERARVEVSKLSPPLKGGTTGEAAVTLERDRSWLSAGGA